MFLVICQHKQITTGKLFRVIFHCLIDSFCFYSIKHGYISVEQHLLTTHDKNLVHDDVLVYNFIEVLLAPSDKGIKDRHQ